MISADEKPGIQALRRRHPDAPAGPGRRRRMEFEYRREGTFAYLAAWDCHRGKVFGRCEPATGIAPFSRLVDQVMSREPYRSARKVFWVVDNGSSPRTGGRPPPPGRLAQPPPGPPAGPRVVAEPGGDPLLDRPAQGAHATSCNSLEELQACLLAFQAHYETAARPFEWKFARHDLEHVLACVGATPVAA